MRDAPISGTSRADAERPPDLPGQETLSQLIARILDQLSVSAWLPAAALVFLLLLIGNVRKADGHLQQALSDIGSISIASVLLLVGATILATMLTQAFQFEAIRLLEGYWGTGRLRTALRDLTCRRHLARRNKLIGRRDDTATRAFTHARTAMLIAGIERAMVDKIEDLRAGRVVVDAPDQHPEIQLQWLDYASPMERRRLDDLVAALSQYPEADHLIQPTRFGNAMRAYEERVHDASGPGPLEGFVQGVFHELPVTMQITHDQLRSRLDLYCSLAVVFVVSGLIGVTVFAALGMELVVATVGLTFALTWLSYRAAVASARAYGSILETIAELRMAEPRVAASH